MKTVGMVLLAAIIGTSTSISTFAVPLDITLTGGTVSHDWLTGPPFGDPLQILAYEDIVNGQTAPGTINLAGVTSITVTWNAPAGYMYVVNPPPADIGPLTLQFETSYGLGAQASSLVSSLGIVGVGASVNTIYGTSPLGVGVIPNSFGLPFPALDFIASTELTSDTKPFAFNSITISARITKRGLGTLMAAYWDGISNHFGMLFGGDTLGDPPYTLNAPYVGPPDPGPLLTLEPLPSGSVPDATSTLTLAGMGFVGLLLFGRKRVLSF